MPKPTTSGSPQESGSGRWRLNPDAPFALTIVGGDAKMIASLTRALQESLNGSRDSLDRGFYLFSKHRLRCVEVDQWVDDVRADFLAGVEQRASASTEYVVLLERPDATEKRRERMLSTFREQAYWGLRIRPSHGFVEVFSSDEQTRRLAEFDLLATAYAQADHGRDRTLRHAELQADVRVRGWRIDGAERACAYCRQFFSIHPPSYYPRIPIHVGCGCDIYPVTGL